MGKIIKRVPTGNVKVEPNQYKSLDELMNLNRIVQSDCTIEGRI